LGLFPEKAQATSPDFVGRTELNPRLEEKSRLVQRRLELVFSRHQASLRRAFERCESGEKSACRLKNWQDFLSDISDDDEDYQLYRVNRYINNFRYRSDRENWKLRDFWAAPEELFGRGGDCEDYVIAKYLSLRALGISADRLRIVVVYDRKKRIDHAILAVFGATDTFVLDNRYKRVRSWDDARDQYRLYYSLNEESIWVHSKRI
jgi:predicted transglutaminase-like cysteine proteinase